MISFQVRPLLVLDCHFVIVAFPVNPLTASKVLFVPEQTVVSGPTEPLSGMPKDKVVALHLLEVGDPPLTEANCEIFIIPGLFGSQMLIPILPNGI